MERRHPADHVQLQAGGRQVRVDVPPTVQDRGVCSQGRQNYKY